MTLGGFPGSIAHSKYLQYTIWVRDWRLWGLSVCPQLPTAALPRKAPSSHGEENRHSQQQWPYLSAKRRVCDVKACLPQGESSPAAQQESWSWASWKQLISYFNAAGPGESSRCRARGSSKDPCGCSKANHAAAGVSLSDPSSDLNCLQHLRDL